MFNVMVHMLDGGAVDNSFVDAVGAFIPKNVTHDEGRQSPDAPLTRAPCPE